ncbi:MAG TPA: hypothetical protein VH724_14770 [Candidatus Angelobacter sp.]|nr:hypothetical protein [Candidatus Angelobacter sp.]
MRNFSKLLVLVYALSTASSVCAQQRPQSAGPSGAVQVQMHNVMYHYTDSVSVHLRDLGGALLPTNAGQIPVFDDRKSFSIQIAAAEIAITPQSLASVLNANVFAGKDAPLKDIEISLEKDRLKVKGKLHNKGDIGFETEGQLTATADGKIRLHAEKIKALHLPVKGMMDLFGLDIADLIKNGKVRGVQVEKDDLILDPSEILPPPRISGRVTAIRLEGNNIVQVFGDPKKYSWIEVPARNYMAYHGNRLQFGKLTMNDTDLLLVDPDPKDPFDFYLDHYKDQLVAGYSKTTPAFGLQVFMVDFNKLKRKSGAVAVARKGK